MGGIGGFVVGSSVGIVKVGWTTLQVTIIRGNSLSAIDALEVSSEIFTYAFEGSRIGAIILGTLFGVSYSIYLAYIMYDYSSRHGHNSSFNNT